VTNDDWTNAELLEVVGALSCSRQLFFKLLEAVVSPNARRGKEQAQLVEKLNTLLKADGFQLRPSGSISGHSAFAVNRISGGVSGAPKNLIFASPGPKPEIVIQDAINNDIRIVRNEEHCLVYDRPIQANGLTKEEMLSWWKERQGTQDESDARRSLSQRLMHLWHLTASETYSASTTGHSRISVTSCQPSFRRSICITTHTRWHSSAGWTLVSATHGLPAPVQRLRPCGRRG
jgi:hypothetical protein